MSRGGGISLQPLALDKGARDATRLADSFEHSLESLAGLPLAGLPPAVRGRVGQSIAHARQSVRDAGMEARGQGAELRRRAALARAADEGGGFGFGAAVDLAFKLWGLSNPALAGVDATAKHWEHLAERAIAGKRVDPLPPSWRAEMNRFGRWAKQLERWSVWGKRVIPLDRMPGRLLKLATPLKRYVPKVGDVISLVSNVRKGMSAAEVAVRGAADVAVGVAAVAGAGVICGALTGATVGAGAAACPFIVGAALSVVGSKATDAAISEGKKGLGAADKALDADTRDRQRRRERRDALRRHPTGRCEIERTQARPLL